MKRDGLLVCRGCGMSRAVEPVFHEPGYEGLDKRDIYLSSKRRVINSLVGELRRFIPSGGRLLDIGCASGELMKAARAAGWDCYGVEISGALAERSRAAGFTVYNGAIEDYSGRTEVDAVVFYEVLSQMNDPRGALDRAFSLLRKGGMVFIREFNASFHLRALSLSGSLPLRLLGLRPGVVHNWNFTPAAMHALLERSGFDSIEVRNARPSSGDPYGTGGRLGPLAVSVFKKIHFTLASLVSALSGGRSLISSVFEARARKPGSDS
ncbi:MAG: class I SAM-dependent methyltransferase [Elusimicrobiales bacterium]|nr:class I SAM-dependent methyltransferase [Elusimicrobiales bacterium]